MTKVFIVAAALMFSNISNAALFNYKKHSSTNSYNVQKINDVKYGQGKTNYYVYKGIGSKSVRSNYRHVTSIPLEMDIYNPSNSGGQRGVVILIPGGGRSACLGATECIKRAIKKGSVSTSTAWYLEQEGSDYNEENTNTARKMAEKGFVVANLNTRYIYHNRQLEISGSNQWSNLLNAGSAHLEPLVVDIKRAARFLTKKAGVYNIDPNNIFVMGTSGGAKMASLANIVDKDKLKTDKPSESNSSFEINNNHLSTPQKQLRGAILISGDTHGLSHLKLINENTGAFMFYHGTTDKSLMHGIAETIEEKCDNVGCKTQFYSIPNKGHGGGETSGTNFLNFKNNTQTMFAHAHDFMVNNLNRADNRPILSFNKNKLKFNENIGTATLEVNLDRKVNYPVNFVIAADQSREITKVNGTGGTYNNILKYVANDQNTWGPVVYNQSTGIAFEKASNVPSKYQNMTYWDKGPGKDNRIVLPTGIEYFTSDFVGKRQRLTIQPNSQKATFTIKILNDGKNESNECFKVRILNPDGAKVVNSVEMVTIIDNDGSISNTTPEFCRNVGDNGDGGGTPVKPKISVSDVTVDEHDGFANVEITSDKTLDNDVVIDIRSSGGTANNGTDYIWPGGPFYVTILRSTGKATIEVEILDDHFIESNEKINMKIFDVLNNNVDVSDDTGTITIKDNDGTVTVDNTPPNLNLSQNSLQSTNPIKVTAIVSDSSGIKGGLLVHTTNTTATYSNVNCVDDSTKANGLPVKITCTTYVKSTGRLVFKAKDYFGNIKYRGNDYKIW